MEQPMTTFNPATVAEHRSLAAAAEAELAEYPQYKGFFDDWGVCEVTKTIKSKWGDVMADPGDRLLIAPADHIEGTDVVYIPAARHWAKNGKGMSTAVGLGKVHRFSRLETPMSLSLSRFD
jgi:hypothetical protein